MRTQIEAVGLAVTFAVLLPLVVIASTAPKAKPFERIDGCRLEPDEWTDGDSLRVRLLDGRLETFRLYNVDTTEARLHGERSDEQAAYFGLTRAQAVELGNEAKTFTAQALAKPFTIYTRWRLVFGGPRFFAVVITGDGKELGELLVSNGLARIYGARTPLPDGRTSREYLARLRELENAAKVSRRGGWGISPAG